MRWYWILELELFEIGVPPKNYPIHLVHRDRNYIYNFWPREGKSIALAWGGLSQCYIHASIMSCQEK